MEKFEGVTVIETSVGWATVNEVEPLTAPEVAVMVDDPAATPDARPEAEIVAVVALVELQTADAVKSFVLPSL